ncbi:RNA-binding protein 34 isoform X3 [Tenebrio molitor]|jgi:nucleolar protein 12|uniref:RNA-binding protein 34 isoform X3 n=1 Tax=Tenebrio molitor TaxID=7067 RepID=UPI0036249F14
MDYSIGSLSDLITGSNTPNKKKVVKKQIAAESNQVVSEESQMDTSVEKSGTKRKLQDNDDENGSVGEVGSTENGERPVKLKKRNRKNRDDPESLSRTIFVGNVPIGSESKNLVAFFKKYGKVESARIRGVPVADPKTPKKVAFIKKKFHPQRKSVFAFVRFEQREDAVKATEADGVIYEDHHLRIHLCVGTEKPDENKAIFVGNLSFSAEEDDLWQLFEPCGAISSVRIVRDNRTGRGKGFGYVNFQDSDSVTLALEMENVKLKERELRISNCNINAAKKNKNNKVKKIRKPGKPKIEKKVIKTKDEVHGKQENGEPKNKSFQGVKFVAKKKIQKPGKPKIEKKVIKTEDEVHGKPKNKSFQGGKFVAKKKIQKPGKPKIEKKVIKTEDEVHVKQENGEPKNKSFQGVKFVQRKKMKFNRGLLKKQKLVKQIAPK